MPRAAIIQPGQSYIFADYFKLNFAPRISWLTSVLHYSVVSEMARREFLIAPVLTDLLHYTQATLNIEYPVAVSNQLKGTLDYLQNQQIFVVIEAKNEDLERSFVQLAIELIALDQWIESDQTLLPGAISTGNIWQFGQFDRQSRVITQDLDLYRVPADLEDLLRILIKTLN